jgi:hypothetical protein
MTAYNGEATGLSRYGESDIALMRRRRAEGASFEQVGREFGVSKSVAWHHTKDVNLEAVQEVPEAVSSVGFTRGALDEDVTITVPLRIKPRTLMTLQSSAQSAGFDNPDEYVESLLQARRIERRRAEAEQEQRKKVNVPQERPWSQAEAVESMKRTYVEGLELNMLMRSMRGEEPPEWLFPEYYARKREEEARRLRQSLFDLANLCKASRWNREQTLRLLRTTGYLEEEIAYYAANTK